MVSTLLLKKKCVCIVYVHVCADACAMYVHTQTRGGVREVRCLSLFLSSFLSLSLHPFFLPSFLSDLRCRAIPEVRATWEAEVRGLLEPMSFKKVHV